MSDGEPTAAGCPPAAVDEALKERAMDEAPVGITISDPSLPDNPLVYVNDAYERLTGYSREEVLGRNCRLLQGPETREAPVAEMARAVAAEERTSVELRNYRKDGTEFWNRVDIAPVHEDGELTHFVGFQTDVTRRVLAERAARERARGLRDERERLRRVLAHVNGLVGDVTEGVVAAASRAALQRAVCRAVGGVDPFAFALVGEYDPASGDVVPAVGSAGGDTAVSAFDVSFEADGPVVRAVESGRVEVVTAGADGLHGGGWPNCYESMAAVPLAYRETVYGALCVYATAADAFDDTEREVLGAIGRVVATGINAVENRRRVATDEAERLTFEVADASFAPVALAAALGERVEYVGAEQADDGLTQLFDVDATADASAVGERVADVDGVARAAEVATHDDGTLLAVETAAQSLVDALAARGVAVVAVEATPAAARVVVDAPGDVDPRSVADLVDDHCGDASLTAVRQRSAVEADDDAVADALTDRQRAVLRRAHAAGYFERTRSVSGEQLASSMGLSPSTFHEHLRAALRKVVDATTNAERLDVDAT